MATKYFCDDCEKEISIQSKVNLWSYYPNLQEFQMCYTCFSKHWKPIKKKFSLIQTYANKN